MSGVYYFILQRDIEGKFFMKNKVNNESFTLEEIAELCTDGQDPKEIYNIIHADYRKERYNNLKNKNIKKALEAIYKTKPRWQP